MAIGYDDDYVNVAYRSLKMWPLRVRLKLFPVIEKAREYQRYFLPNPKITSADIPECSIGEALEASTDHFQEHGWAFVEDVFDSDFHAFLCSHWPQRRYFTAPFDRYKAYDKGFRWVQRDPAKSDWGKLIAQGARCDRDSPYPSYFDRHPHLQKLFDYLTSDALISRLNRYSGTEAELKLNRFQLTTSYPGTLVAPHKDSQQGAKNWISLIFHIDGFGGPNSGGLSICNDNKFDDTTFEVTELRNTCLLFDPAAPFYHGVKPVERGKFRRMLSAEYVSLDEFGSEPE